MFLRFPLSHLRQWWHLHMNNITDSRYMIISSITSINILHWWPPGSRNAIPVSESSTYSKTNSLKKNHANVFMSFLYLICSSGIVEICDKAAQNGTKNHKNIGVNGYQIRQVYIHIIRYVST